MFICLFYNDSKVFFNTPSAVASGDGDMPISSSCEDTLGFEFVAIGDFKISAGVGDGKSEGVVISIYISSTEGANQGADGRICGKISIANLDIGRCILSGADANKFTLKGNKLTFEATDFEARSDVAYRVKVQGLCFQA
jgi:hypothetical protein